jgi:hypothetical protein
LADCMPLTGELAGEDLVENLVLDLVELFEGGLEDYAIVSGGCVHVVTQTMGGVVHQQLGVLEALGVPREAHVDEMGVVFNALESGTGVIGVAVEHLFAGELGHGVNEFSVEEALFARIGLLGALLELIDGFRGGDRVVDG